MKRKEITKTFLMFFKLRKTIESPSLIQKYFSIVRVKDRMPYALYTDQCHRITMQILH